MLRQSCKKMVLASGSTGRNAIQRQAKKVGMFANQEPDEKQQLVKQFLKDLEGKDVPEHIMKTINEEMQRFL